MLQTLPSRATPVRISPGNFACVGFEMFLELKPMLFVSRRNVQFVYNMENLINPSHNATVEKLLRVSSCLHRFAIDCLNVLCTCRPSLYSPSYHPPRFPNTNRPFPWNSPFSVPPVYFSPPLYAQRASPIYSSTIITVNKPTNVYHGKRSASVVEVSTI